MKLTRRNSVKTNQIDDRAMLTADDDDDAVWGGQLWPPCHSCSELLRESRFIQVSRVHTAL